MAFVSFNLAMLLASFAALLILSVGFVVTLAPLAIASKLRVPRGALYPLVAISGALVASQDRYEKTRAVSDNVMMTVTWNGRPEAIRSHLSEILDLANHTGRRLGAIRQLTYADILPDQGRYGSLRFRADTDKMGYESAIPMVPEVRSVIDLVLRERPGIGGAPLFPAPKDPAEPVSRFLCAKWLREAEKLAGVEPLDGKLWHAYRAKFATELVDVPDRVVAKLGGWKAVRTLDIYQQPGEEAMLQAIESRKELREVRG